MDDHSRDAVAQRLKEAREKGGFPTAADAARSLGLKPATVRAHESGQNGVSASMAAQYAKAYGVSVEWLLYGALREYSPAPLGTDRRLPRQVARGPGAFAFDLNSDDDRPLIENLLAVVLECLERALRLHFDDVERDDSFSNELSDAILKPDVERMLTAAVVMGLIDEHVYMDLFTLAELQHSESPNVLISPEFAGGVRRLVNRNLPASESPLVESDNRAAVRWKFLSACTTLIRELITAAIIAGGTESPSADSGHVKARRAK